MPYVLGTCRPVPLSSDRWLRAVGVVDLAVVAALAIIERDGLVSRWCGWAAVDVLIVARLRTRAEVSPATRPRGGARRCTAR